MLSQSFAANIFVRFCSDRLRDLCPEWLRDLCSEWLRDFHPYEVIRLLVAANNGPAAACLIIMQSNTAVLHIRFLQIAQNCLCQLVSGEKVWHMTYLCEKSNNIYFFIFLDESKKIVGFFLLQVMLVNQAESLRCQIRSLVCASVCLPNWMFD